MNTTLTAKLKLLTTPDQFRALRATQLAYRAALNQVSAYSFAHGKTSNRKRLQKATYADLRRQFGLPARMACNVPRQVGSTYQALWTKAIKNAEARRLGYTKRRGVSLDHAPHYVSPTLTYNLGRDYSLREGRQMSLLTLQGRIHVPYQGSNRHVALLQEGATFGAAKLWYDRGKQRFFLLVALTIQTPDPTPVPQHQIVGIDVGSRYLATVATLDNGAEFYSRRGDPRQGGPLRPPAKTPSAKGHSLGHTAQNRAWPARETAQAEYQPRHQQTHPGYPPPCFHRLGRVDGHSRTHETAHTTPERQAALSRVQESPPRQSTREQMGFCGTTGIALL